MIKFEIDGKELTVQPGSSIIEAADNAGINIPRFCYHKKLSIAANCRMCLVEVANAPKPMPACATPVAEGMQVKTKSSKALMAQRAVMEFLLINHPLDCPICDQGGQCELQDVSMGYGEGISNYNQGKRSVKDEDIGPLIATGMTRCIHCTRCVRFGEEVAGMKELGGLGRGESTEIRTFINNSVDSELSGNMIDLCPVGALTSKPFRFSARAWELQQRPSIAPHDALGSNIYVHSVNNKVKQVVPRDNEEINESWLSDRDRFSFEGLNNDERLHTPLLRIDDKLEAIDWDTALELVVDAIAEQVNENANDLVALMSPNSTVEEGYLLQKIVRNLGSNNIDHRLKLVHDFETGCINTSVNKIENADGILLIGAAPRKSLPLLNHRVRKAALNGAKVCTLNPAAFDWNFSLSTDYVVSPSNMAAELAGVLKHLYDVKGKSLPKGLRHVKVSEKAKLIAGTLSVSSSPLIIFGDMAIAHPDADYMHTIFEYLYHILDCGAVVIPEGCNSKGLFMAGAVSDKQAGGYAVAKPGNNVLTAFERPNTQGTYLLFNIEPEFDCIDGKQALDKLKNSKKVICFSPFISESMSSYADIVLPIAPFTETSGTFVNLDNKWQNFAAVVSAAKYSKSRPGWKVLCAIAKMLGFASDEFDFESSADVKQEVFGLNTGVLANTNKEKLDIEESNDSSSHKIEVDYKSKITKSSDSELTTVYLVSQTNCYKTDNIVRRALSLQATTDAKFTDYIIISEKLAESMGVNNGDDLAITLASDIDDRRNLIRKIVVCDARLTDDVAYITTGSEDTFHLTKPYEKVVLLNR